MEEKIESAINDLKNDQSEELKQKIGHLEEENMKHINEAALLASVKSQLEIDLESAKTQNEKLSERLKSQKKSSDEAKRNPKRAATAVAAVAVRGNRHQQNPEMQGKISFSCLVYYFNC